jgi:glycosyltransferase involved in cell wall biosynthesis
MKYYGGAELVVIRLANYLTKKGIKNGLVTLAVNPKLKEELKGTEIILPKTEFSFNKAGGFTSKIDMLNGIYALAKLTNEHIGKFDVVNAYNFPANWAKIFSSSKIPLVWYCNEPPLVYRKNPSVTIKVLGAIRLFFDKTVVNSNVKTICVADKFNQARIREIYGRDSSIIPYGIDYSTFSKGNRKKAVSKYNLKNKFVIVQSGILSDQKNQMATVTALEKVTGKIPNIKIIFAGEDNTDYGYKLKEHVEKNNLCFIYWPYR